MPYFEIELKKTEYGHVTISAKTKEEALKKYKENGGEEFFHPDEHEIKQIGSVFEKEERY